MSTQTYGREMNIRGEPGFTIPMRSVVRWAGVFAGAVIAIGLLFLLTSFWQALAYSSDITWFADTIDWWDAASSIVCLFIAGLLAAWLAGTRGWGAGLLNGLTAWGLLITGTVVFGVGSAVATTTLARSSASIGNPEPGSFWPVFVAYIIGVVMASIGGVIGGYLPRPQSLFHHIGADRSMADRDDADVDNPRWSDRGLVQSSNPQRQRESSSVDLTESEAVRQ